MPNHGAIMLIGDKEIEFVAVLPTVGMGDDPVLDAPFFEGMGHVGAGEDFGVGAELTVFPSIIETKGP